MPSIRDLGFNSYQAYLQSPHWKKVRQEYKDSCALQGCFVCGSPYVQLHHRTYKNLGDEPLRDLIPLCGRHHLEVHDLVKSGRAKLWEAPEIVKGGLFKKRKKRKRSKKRKKKRRGFSRARSPMKVKSRVKLIR